MVRRGSTVRVRQRALQKPRMPALFISDRFADSRTWGRYGALYGAFRSKTAIREPDRPGARRGGERRRPHSPRRGLTPLSPEHQGAEIAIQAHAFSVGQLMTSWLTACATASWAPGLKTAIGAPIACRACPGRSLRDMRPNQVTRRTCWWPVIGASSRYFVAVLVVADNASDEHRCILGVRGQDQGLAGRNQIGARS